MRILHSENQRFKNANSNPIAVSLQALGLRIILSSAYLRKKFIEVGEIARYLHWLGDNFAVAKIYGRRERLWEEMGRQLEGDEFRGIEFGVAWGYLTQWWFRRYTNNLIAWDGFDRFTGLPRKWRNLDKGAFDAKGNPPAIKDGRITWHIGDVDDKIQDLEFPGDRNYRLVVFFDLDIFEPSYVAWQKALPELREGDMLYFDEAFDLDERRLLNEYVFPSGTFKFVGATYRALALEVIEITSTN